MDEQKVCVHSDCSNDRIFGIDLCEKHFLKDGHYQSPSAKKRLKMIISYFRDLSDENRSKFPGNSYGQGGVIRDLFFGTIKLRTARETVNQIAAANEIPLLETKIPLPWDHKSRRRWYEKVENLSMCCICQRVDEEFCNNLDGPLICDECVKTSLNPKTLKPRYELIQKIEEGCVGLIFGARCGSVTVDSKLTLTGLGGAPFPAGRLCQNCVDIEVRRISEGLSSFNKCYECGTHSTSGTYGVKHHWHATLTDVCDGCYWVYPK